MENKRSIVFDDEGIEMSNVTSKELLAEIKAKIMPKETEAENPSNFEIKNPIFFKDKNGNMSFGDESAYNAYVDFKEILNRTKQAKRESELGLSM